MLEIRDMYIDVGAASDWDVQKKLDIRPGDPIVPDSPFTVMANPNLLLAKAWDNRIGCALAAETAAPARGHDASRTRCSRVATVQEEVGLRGAQTSAFKVAARRRRSRSTSASRTTRRAPRATRSSAAAR